MAIGDIRTIRHNSTFMILHSKATAVVLLGIAAMKMFFIWAPYLFMPPATLPAASVASTADGARALLGQNGVRLMGGESTILLICFIAFVGFFVAAEFQNGTIRNILSLGKCRTTMFISKLLMSFTALTAIFVITVVVAVVGHSLQYGFGDMRIAAFVRYFAWNFFLQLL